MVVRPGTGASAAASGSYYGGSLFRYWVVVPATPYDAKRFTIGVNWRYLVIFLRTQTLYGKKGSAEEYYTGTSEAPFVEGR